MADWNAATGGPKMSPVSGDTFGPTWLGIGTVSLSANDMRACAVIPDCPLTFNALQAAVTTLTVGGLAHLAVMLDDITNPGRVPGLVLVDGGTVVQDTTGVKTTATFPTITLLPGVRYWFAMRQEGTAGAAMQSGTTLPMIARATPAAFGSNTTTVLSTGSTGTLTSWPGTGGAPAGNVATSPIVMLKAP